MMLTQASSFSSKRAWAMVFAVARLGTVTKINRGSIANYPNSKEKVFRGGVWHSNGNKKKRGKTQADLWG